MWFNPAELTKTAQPPPATSAILATFQIETDDECLKVAEVAEVATGHNSKTEPLQNETDKTNIKPLSLQERRQEARRLKVIAMLEAAPDTQRAIYTDSDGDPHNVILTVAIRGIGTCELLIPKAKYDPWRLLELVERQGVQNVY